MQSGKMKGEEITYGFLFIGFKKKNVFDNMHSMDSIAGPLSSRKSWLGEVSVESIMLRFKTILSKKCIPATVDSKVKVEFMAVTPGS